jgi:hypothetical protein
MTTLPSLPSPLPRFDHNLLCAVERFVPRAEREEWARVWQSELWHMRHRSRNRGPLGTRDVADLSFGLLCDALWLRSESWRRIFSGTATLCLASLSGLLIIAMLYALALNGDWQTMGFHLGVQFRRFLFEAPLVVLVNIGIASRIHTERSSRNDTARRLMGQLFFVAKTLLTLLLAFMVSADFCQPVGGRYPILCDLLQTFAFIILALVGLRWAFRDQDQRCKQCLRSLALPARIGRPSHNLLEWNGTELACKRGHGLLSVPEMESSWCQSSRWVDLEPVWDQPANI